MASTDQGPPAAAVSGLPDGHGLAAAARYPPRRQAGQALHVGGGGKGRPAAASYAGDGEPGFAGDPGWEKYMQVGATRARDAHSDHGGPAPVGVSFVREMWEPEGLPQPLQRGRVLTDDRSTWVTPAWRRSDRRPVRGPGTAKDTPSRRAIFVCEPKPLDGRARVPTKILSRWRAGLSASVTHRGRADADGILRERDGATAAVRRRDSVRARTNARRSGFPAARARDP